MSAIPPNELHDFKVIRRNGSVVPFASDKIALAMSKAFLAVEGGPGSNPGHSSRIREQVARLTDAVVGALLRRQPAGGAVHIEAIQDQVELGLMRSGEHDVARAYVLYREKRASERAARQPAPAAVMLQVEEGGRRRPLDRAELLGLVEAACSGLGEAGDSGRRAEPAPTAESLRVCSIIDPDCEACQ